MTLKTPGGAADAPYRADRGTTPLAPRGQCEGKSRSLLSDCSVRKHRVSDALEAGEVRAFDALIVPDRSPRDALRVDSANDAPEPLVHFFAAP